MTPPLARLAFRRVALPALALLVAACQAGPSAFDAPGGDAGVPDTAAVADLPDIPGAPDVEPADSSAGLEPGGRLPDSDSVPIEEELPDALDRGAAPEGTEETRAPVTDGERLVFPRPENVRGLYLNAWASGSSRRVDALLEVAERTEVNAFVIDIKDASGYVSHRSDVPLAREIGATGEIRIGDLPGLLRKLHAAGVYPIARIVIVKDPLLIEARPQWAVQDTAGGVWTDSKGIIWVNLWNRGAWDYHVDLAREVVAMGFPEVQWDYVRFPDAPRSDLERAVFPGGEGRERAEAVRGFLAHSREELAPLGAEVTADVFGVTTSFSGDVGIGQVWESFIDVVDVALPMVYPSHYWEGSYGVDEPNAFPYEVVREALEDALRRSEAVEGAGKTRPWLQDFSLGQPPYGAPEVRAQIQATYDAGIQEWILWNPGSRYTVEALEPVGGFAEEPEIRVADRVVPVSRRWEALEPQQPELVAPGGQGDELSGAAADSLASPGGGAPAPDTSAAGPGRR